MPKLLHQRIGIKTGVVKTFSDPIAGNFTIQNCQGKTGTSTDDYYKNGWHQGTGRVNLADLDGDGKLNTAFVSGNSYMPEGRPYSKNSAKTSPGLF